jgi:pyridoxamine 5'-phosphate oxidase
MLDTAWSLMSEAVQDRRAPFHLPAVASITNDGNPSIRTVVLRGVEKNDRCIRFHTDKRAPKYTELLKNSAVSVHFYDGPNKTQIRLLATASLNSGNNLAADAWASSQRSSKLCYAAYLGPGTPVYEPPKATKLSQVEIEKGFINFCVVQLKISNMECLELAADGHRRAIFDWSENDTVRGNWLSP